VKKKDGEMDKDRGVPTDPNLLNAPSVLKGNPPLTRDPLSSIETSNGSSATEGGDGLEACGDCPACKAVDYIDAHGDVITEVVTIGEGVFLGPDDSYFDSSTHEVVMDFRKGIGVIAIDKNNAEAVDWWAEQENLLVT
jgi:hypothetical protein